MIKEKKMNKKEKQQVEILNIEINKLLERVSALEAKTGGQIEIDTGEIELHKWFLYEMPIMHKISLSAAIQQIVSHLGLQWRHIPETTTKAKAVLKAIPLKKK